MVQLADKKADHQPFADKEIREYLQKLLACSDFDASARNKRFLSYVVEETLSGRAKGIKAYNIALAAFDRGEDFDPTTDPIVRIEASRLRRSLEHYYLTTGKADQIRIDIPKGSYIASFTSGNAHKEQSVASSSGRASSAGPPKPRPGLRSLLVESKRISLVAASVLAVAVLTAWAIQQIRSDADPGLSRGPKIVVQPFQDASGHLERAFVARGLTYDIIANLTRFNDLFVYGPETSFDVGSSALKRESLGIQADFTLSGSVITTATTLRVSATLADTRTGKYVWSWSNEAALTPSNLLKVQTDIADRVARALAQPYGAVFERTAIEISGKPGKDLLSYECVVRFQQYWRTYDSGQYDDLLSCMERTVKADPAYARAYSCLALLYVDAHRFGYGTRVLEFDPVQRALELADTAVKLEPLASEGYLALSVTRWFAHDVEGSINAATQGLALNPNNTILIAELGIRHALLAQWDESKAMLDKLFALNPQAPAGYRRGRFLYAYMHGDFKSALAEMMSAELPLNIYDYVFRAMAYAQLGDMENARIAVSEILKFDPNYGERVEADFRKRNTHPSIVRAIVDGLTKAGLESAAKNGTN
jgi:adenylate cyclase